MYSSGRVTTLSAISQVEEYELNHLQIDEACH
jgi:hypothetical protein